MKNFKMLTKAEMRKVAGGSWEGNPCELGPCLEGQECKVVDDQAVCIYPPCWGWEMQPPMTCYNCCITIFSYETCATRCGV